MPRTSGIGFQRPLDAPREGKLVVFKKNGDLSELVEATVRDLFRRLDKIHFGGSLGLEDFSTFLRKACGETISNDFYKYNVLAKFAHNDENEVTIRGFLGWFKQWIQQKGTAAAPRIFENLGYDEDLYPTESRTFSMSIHTPREVILYAQDRTESDSPNPNPQLEHIEEVVDREMVRRHGSSVQNEPLQYDLVMRHNDVTDTFSFGLTNLKTTPAAFPLDCSASRNVHHSEPGGKVTRYIKSGEFLFLMHVEAAEDVEEFTVQYSVILEEI